MDATLEGTILITNVRATKPVGTTLICTTLGALQYIRLDWNLD